VGGSARPRQRDGLQATPPGLGIRVRLGCYRQATANDVSKRRPNFHHQLPSTKAVPDVGNDKPSTSSSWKLINYWGRLSAQLENRSNLNQLTELTGLMAYGRPTKDRA